MQGKTNNMSYKKDGSGKDKTLQVPKLCHGDITLVVHNLDIEFEAC